MFIAESNFTTYQEILPDQQIWVNPVGGLGDMLMASSVMKMVVDKNPERKFNVVRRSRFVPFFLNHPAVRILGNPPKESVIMSTMFWSYSEEGKTEHGPGLKRPFQLLAKKFGLEIPVSETFYFPNEESDPILLKVIPWKSKNVIIAPTSDSGKKNMNPTKWVELISKITDNDTLIIQAGLDKDPYIPGTFNLLGLTTPGQLISLIRRCDFVITADNFIMHAAHYTDKPAIVIWGPTFSEEFGYADHIHIRPSVECEFIYPCMGRKGFQEFNEYHKPCHLPAEKHCLNFIDINLVIKEFNSLRYGK